MSAGKPLIVDEAWGATCRSTRTCRPGRWTPAPTSAWSACTRWAPGSNRARCSMCRATSSTDRLSACADLLMTTSPNVHVYAAMDGWRRQMVEHGHELLGAALDLAARFARGSRRCPVCTCWTRNCCGAEASHDLDRLQILIDCLRTWASAGTRPPTGCAPTAGRRRPQRPPPHPGHHVDGRRRPDTAERLLSALEALVTAAPGLPDADRIDCPTPSDLRAGHVDLPRDAFFGRGRACPSPRPPGGSPPNRSPLPARHSRGRARRTAHGRGSGLPAHRPARRDGAARPRRPDPGHHPGHRRVTPGFPTGRRLAGGVRSAAVRDRDRTAVSGSAAAAACRHCRRRCRGRRC